MFKRVFATKSSERVVYLPHVSIEKENIMPRRFKNPPRKRVLGGYAAVDQLVDWYEQMLYLGPEDAVAEALIDPNSGRRVTRRASKELLRVHVAQLQ